MMETRHSRKELLIILTPHVVRGRSEAEYIKQVEMARMSWISCDIFNWMNTDSSVTGQLDSNTIPTIYPDQTPGAEAFKPVVPPPPLPRIDSGTPTESETDYSTQAPAPKVVIPEWQIEKNERTNGDGEIQLMSFSSPNQTQSESKRAKQSDATPTDTQKKKTARVRPEYRIAI